MKHKLKSSYPCLVKTNNEAFDIDENDILEIEGEERLFIYPLSYSRRNIPFYINLNDLKDCDKFSVFDIDDDILIFLNKTERVRSFAKESLSFNDDKCDISISENVLRFENKNAIIEYELEKAFLSFRVFKLENFACVELDSCLVYAFNMKDNRFLLFKGNEIEFEKDLLKLKDNLNDCEDRRKSFIYKFSGDKVEIEKSEFSHTDLHLNKEMTAYRFLEALKVKDYAFAKNFLSGNLKNIKEKELSNFLGNISNFYPLSTNDYIVDSKNFKNLVRFDIKSGMINDISVDKL